jgi:hypothetical protein
LTCFNGALIIDHLLLPDSSEILNIDGDSLFLLKNHIVYNLSAKFTFPVNMPIKNMIFNNSTLYFATLKNVFKCDNLFSAINDQSVHVEPLSISFNGINDILMNDNKLYIASDEGLTVIPEKVINSSISPPPIPYLKSLVVNDENYPLTTRKISITGNHKINVAFGCINF